MITAIITVKTATGSFVFDGVAASSWTLEAFARQLFDEPCSVTVMVQQ